MAESGKLASCRRRRGTKQGVLPDCHLGDVLDFRIQNPVRTARYTLYFAS
jgi:hypothetical protein